MGWCKECISSERVNIATLNQDSVSEQSSHFVDENVNDFLHL